MTKRWLKVLKSSQSKAEIVEVLHEITKGNDELTAILAKFAIMHLSDYGEPERQVKKWWRIWK